ncbi:MAG TPA: long-chain fatty acid--CoA ligase [Thermoanaerobaculia bacterium]|jgi:long-chain acyl-CoA synthetase|nr:long-chain fatty acid--CoA ligase [Thermoanaerobaculia bacterium]
MDAPWLQHYDEGVPHSIGTYPEKTLVDFVADHAREKPDAPALIFKGRPLSWRELDAQSDALAGALQAEGVKPGDRVALILPNCPQFVISELAIWKLGAIVASENPIYTDHELIESLEETTPRLAIVLTRFYEQIKRIQPRTTLTRVIATNIKEYLPPLLGVMFTLFKERKEGHRVALHPSDFSFREALSNEPARYTPPKPDDPAVIIMSGGTTGTAKGVLSDHRALVIAGTQIGAWLREALEGPGASVMLPLPLFHTYACTGAQGITFLRGIPLILIPNPRDIDDLVASVHRDKPALFCGVPTLFNALLNHRDVISGKADFRSIRACFSGAAALMAETKKRFEELTGGRIVEGYSLTEAAMACCVNPVRGPNKIGSVGMPLPDVLVKIVDGEIVMKAPQIMRGYWNHPETTAEILRDGWLYTGDLGTMDEDGYVFLIDRKKDVIKVSGLQVWPREVEEVIAAHPSVAEVGVAGLPDPVKSEIVAAWIVPRPGETVDAETIKQHCRKTLAPYKVPSRIEFRESLPKTMVGKVLRRELVAETLAKV